MDRIRRINKKPDEGRAGSTGYVRENKGYRILRNVSAAVGVIVFIVVIIIQWHPGSSTSPVDCFYSRVSEYEKENPLSISVPDSRSEL